MNIKLNTGQLFTQVFTCTCKISYGRGNRSQKPKHSYRRANQFGEAWRICPNVQNKTFPNVVFSKKRSSL